MITSITRDRALGDGFEFSTDGQSLIYADGATVRIAYLLPSSDKNFKTSQKIINYTADGAVETIAALNDKFFAGISSSGAVNIWKIGQPVPVARLVFEKNGAWTVIDAKGRFDTSSIETNQAVHVFSTGSTANRMKLQDCRDIIWIPGLLDEVLDEDLSAN